MQKWKLIAVGGIIVVAVAAVACVPKPEQSTSPDADMNSKQTDMNTSEMDQAISKAKEELQKRGYIVESWDFHVLADNERLMLYNELVEPPPDRDKQWIVYAGLLFPSERIDPTGGGAVVVFVDKETGEIKGFLAGQYGVTKEENADALTPAQSHNVWKKICAEHEGMSIAVLKDREGNPRYLQIPFAPGDDQFTYLYDLSGNHIVTAGGFAPDRRAQDHFAALTAGLTQSLHGSCADIMSSDLDITREQAIEKAKTFMATFPNRADFEEEVMQVEEAMLFWDVWFRRRTSTRPNAGIVRIDKGSGVATWIPQR